METGTHLLQISSWDKMIWGTVKGSDTMSCPIHFPFLALIIEFEQDKVDIT